jgi:hypothetical protein
MQHFIDHFVTRCIHPRVNMSQIGKLARRQSRLDWWMAFTKKAGQIIMKQIMADKIRSQSRKIADSNIDLAQFEGASNLFDIQRYDFQPDTRGTDRANRTSAGKNTDLATSDMASRKPGGLRKHQSPAS